MRLIDADNLESLCDIMADKCDGIGKSIWNQFRTIVEWVPIIDAVPVVRCKDCRWKEQEQPGMVYCPAIVGGWVDEDWFCKGGETDETD